MVSPRELELTVGGKYELELVAGDPVGGKYVSGGTAVRTAMAERKGDNWLRLCQRFVLKVEAIQDHSLSGPEASTPHTKRI